MKIIVFVKVYKYLGDLPVLWWLMLIGLVNQYSNALFSCQKNSLLLAFNWDSTSALLSVRKNWNDDINTVHLVKFPLSDENKIRCPIQIKALVYIATFFPFVAHFQILNLWCKHEGINWNQGSNVKLLQLKPWN